jgi:lipoprotein-releasing system permease protein
VFRPLAFNIGLRYASSRRSFVSFISIVAIAGLVLSVAVLLLVTAVMNGFEREMRERILGLVPHAQLRGRLTDSDANSIVAKVSKVDGVRGAARYVEAAGLLAAHGAVAGVVFHGMDPAEFHTVSDLSKFVIAGSMSRLQTGSFGVVIGRSLATRLGVTVGDSVMAVLPDGAVTVVGLIPRQKRLEVVAVFDTSSELDTRGVYIELHDAQRLFRLRGTIQGVDMRLSDVFAASAITAAAVARVGDDVVYPVTWMRTQGNLYRAIGFQRAMMFLLLSLLVAVAAFNLVSALIMVVNQRRGDVAVLRTLGGEGRTIVGAFVTLGAVIGVVGVALGVALGTLAAVLVEDGYRWLESEFGLNLMSQYFITYLPSELRLADVTLVAGTALTLCFLSTLYPAWRAAALKPAEVLRHE